MNIPTIQTLSALIMAHPVASVTTASVTSNIVARLLFRRRVKTIDAREVLAEMKSSYAADVAAGKLESQRRDEKRRAWIRKNIAHNAGKRFAEVVQIGRIVNWQDYWRDALASVNGVPVFVRIEKYPADTVVTRGSWGAFYFDRYDWDINRGDKRYTDIREAVIASEARITKDQTPAAIAMSGDARVVCLSPSKETA